MSRHFEAEFEYYDETPRGRLAKLPFGIMMIIVLTGLMSHFLENHAKPVSDNQVITVAPTPQNSVETTPRSLTHSQLLQYYLIGAALFLQAIAGYVAFKIYRSTRPAIARQRAKGRWGHSPGRVRI